MMKEKTKKTYWWKWVLYVLLAPFILFFILGIIIYIPPAQNFIVAKVAESLSETTGVDMSVKKVRLAFPLDLAIHEVVAVDHGDTIVAMRAARLDVRLWPLFKGMVEVDGLETFDVKVNSGKWIPDVYLRGTVDKFTASIHGVDLGKERVNLNYAGLLGANLYVALSDTGEVAETSQPSNWKIMIDKIQLEQSRLALSMPGDSMRVEFQMDKLALEEGLVDLEQATYGVDKLKLIAGKANYLVRQSWNDGSSGNGAFHVSDSLAWDGFVPRSEGLDPGFITLERFDFDLKKLNYEENGKMVAHINNFSLRERSGLRLEKLSARLMMDQDIFQLKDFSLSLPSSHLEGEAELDLNAFAKDAENYGSLQLRGCVGAQDIRVLANGFADAGLLKNWPDSPLKVEVLAHGDVRSVKVDTCQVDWPGVVGIRAGGEIFHPADENRMGEVDLEVRTYNLDFLNRLIAGNGVGFTLPGGLVLNGVVNVNRNDYRANVRGTLGEGKLSASGKINLENERYETAISSEHFPFQKFLPESDLGLFSATFGAEGRGFDIFSKSTQLKANFQLDELLLNEWQLGQIVLNANLEDGQALVNFSSANDVLGGEGTIEATIDKVIDLKLRSDLPEINLQNILALKQPLTLGTGFSLDAYTNSDFTAYGVEGLLEDIRFITAEKGIPARDVNFKFDTSSDTTMLSTSAGDLEMRLAAAGGVDRIKEELRGFADAVGRQIEGRRLDQKALKAAAPVLDFHLSAGHVNPMGNLLREMGYVFNTAQLDLSISPEEGAWGDFRLSAFSNGKLLLDTVTVNLIQDSTGLVAKSWVKNFTKKNKSKFEGSLKSYLLDNGAGAEVLIRAHNGVKGMHFGVLAQLEDAGVKVHLYPEHPVIAFRNFTVNKNNYFYLGNDSIIQADVDLLADDGTGLRIYTQPSNVANDITISLNQLNLDELSKVFPYLPLFGGMLSGDLHIMDDHKSVSAMASVTTERLMLEGAQLGNVGLEAIYLPQDGGEHHANVFVSSEGNEVLSLAGIYRSESEDKAFEGTADLLDFPLELLNGFLAEADIALSGYAAGNLSVGGDMKRPRLNGELQFNDARMTSDVYGLDFRLDNQPVRMVDNQLVVSDYALYSRQNKNPLLLNGNLDMRNLSNVRMDFEMAANNFELINTKKNAKSLVYGKVYADFLGTLKGSMEDVSVRGNLKILGRTDVTYILKDSPLTVDDRLHDLVQFVNFEDSVEEVEPVVQSVGNFDMTLGVQISDAALFHCSLSEDGSNYVDLEGGGDLTLRLTQQGDMRLTGRFTANSGEMAYSLPVIPLKTFKLVHGSYVDFTGDVANPTLNIAAKERLKSMVTENDQPRSVAFDVGVKITQPLDRMGLEFTIEAPEDLAVQNQLAAMTKAERGKAAVAMLATGMYLTDDTFNSGTSGFKASNALTAFLQSEIQNIAGSALKTIDVSIGMENNTTSSGATTTDYSFQFAKRFWGNKITVIVGGKVSTGAEAENSAESFIDNIAIEYRLDRTASRYVRVFYERSFQDPLEGQLTKTGAGLVLRRKSYKLGDLFIFRTKNSDKKKEAKKEKR